MNPKEALEKLKECDHYLEELGVVEAEVERLRAENEELAARLSFKALANDDAQQQLAVYDKLVSGLKTLQESHAKVAKLEAENAELRGAKEWLEKSDTRLRHAVYAMQNSRPCPECGAEPGCNIDCSTCVSVPSTPRTFNPCRLCGELVCNGPTVHTACLGIEALKARLAWFEAYRVNIHRGSDMIAWEKAHPEPKSEGA